MIVAAATWQIRPIGTVADFFEHLEEIVSAASSAGATLLVLPELLIVELLALHAHAKPQDAPRILSQYAPGYEAEISRLAQKHEIAIVAGSHLRSNAERFSNACMIAWSDGTSQFQLKNCLTQWEIDPWKLSPGDGLTTLKDNRIGVAICYDCEFPEAVRAHAENGVQLLCVPSYTETQRGFQRVRWCSLARAVENQIFVVHSSCVADPALELVSGSAYGSSAVIAPSIQPFPENPVLAQTVLNKEGLALAQLNFGDLTEARNDFDVRNWNDRHKSKWPIV